MSLGAKPPSFAVVQSSRNRKHVKKEKVSVPGACHKPRQHKGGTGQGSLALVVAAALIGRRSLSMVCPRLMEEVGSCSEGFGGLGGEMLALAGRQGRRTLATAVG